ncbi:AraC-like DNA-binding protein [Paenibacillus shirakamiensis]|uniref:AraC-like DNA-binding protein n=1 Tax=Paenibacillus shirakamiensis TaxID=1265935 RepID=A0ABS4JHL3_9BACL|nr:AraC family transcriptional regulator [Paenibacillus shirakamiensis]MBP2001203.1 AraC-like DNA-binding protein [Paenibacillus shirakamiensis]
MTTHMDYVISKSSTRIIDLKMDPSKLRVPFIRIGQVGHLPDRFLFREKASFESWAIVYIARGTGVYQADQGGEQRIMGGDVFFFTDQAHYRFGPDVGTSWDEYYINIYGSRIQEWVEQELLTPGLLLHVGRHEKWTHKLENVFDLMESGVPANADRAALQLESMLFEFKLAAEGVSALDGTWESVRRDLEEAIYGTMNPQDLAEKYHVSLSTLRRLVRHHTGYPLHDYIQRLKISEAKQLLLNTDMQIKEIALKLNFQDPLYFSRRFKRFAGIPANEFRGSI